MRSYHTRFPMHPSQDFIVLRKYRRTPMPDDMMEVSHRFAPWKHVWCYGAIAGYFVLATVPNAAEIQPDGMNSKSLAAALSRAKPGDTLRLAEGSYDIGETVAIKTGVNLVGAGQDKTRLVYTGTQQGSLLHIGGCENVEVAHLTLDGGDNPAARDGIAGSNSKKLFLHHLTIRNLGKDITAFSHGIILTGDNPSMARGVTDSIIRDCRFERIGLKAQYGGAIRLAWGSTRNLVERNVINGTGRGGIFGDHSPGLTIRHNRIAGSGGEGLGIEIWGGCTGSIIEDNVVDHWLSVDKGAQSAVRRNVVGTADGTHKPYGIEIVSEAVVVTDNVVKGGTGIGLSVSNTLPKNNVYWGYNTISDCTQWGAQFQGDTGGITNHYLYRCTFERTLRGDPRAIYPSDSGHGFRFNGSSRNLVFEECVFKNNGGQGIQIGGGPDVDAMTFVKCVFSDNALEAGHDVAEERTMEFDKVRLDRKSGKFSRTKRFATPPPVADFSVPLAIRVGVAASFACHSSSKAGEIVTRLWDFNHGIPELTATPSHVFDNPGKHRVTLVVWDIAGRGARMEKIVEVLPGPK